jgi:hypothetical protein
MDQRRKYIVLLAIIALAAGGVLYSRAGELPGCDEDKLKERVLSSLQDHLNRELGVAEAAKADLVLGHSFQQSKTDEKCDCLILATYKAADKEHGLTASYLITSSEKRGEFHAHIKVLPQ